MRDPHSIVITGASAGLGQALAVCYARPGRTLALSGRDAGRLAAVTDLCQAAGARVLSLAVDVTDRQAMAEWLDAVDAAAPVDLVIANAGIAAGAGPEDQDRAQDVFATNLHGVLNTVQPLIPAMARRRRGQIALMSSLAGFRGLPGAASYCASKAAVRLYGEALRSDLAGQGISVSVICPGFVRTGMTAGNRFPMPFLMDADRAALTIGHGLAAGRSRIAFPWPLTWAVWVLAALPPAWTDGLLARRPDLSR